MNRYKLRNKEKPWWEDNPMYMTEKELKRKMKSVEKVKSLKNETLMNTGKYAPAPRGG